MCDTSPPEAPRSVPDRLIDAARQCFLCDDYHEVSTRRIAELAGVNASMIRYYFGNKEGLYEEMIRATLAPLLEVLDSDLLQDAGSFGDYLRLYYRLMSQTPEFPKLILKVLALKAGPGRRFIHQLLERGRSRGQQRLEAMKAQGLVPATLDADITRMAFVSLAMMPMLLRDVFEEQMERSMDGPFLEALADFNGRIFGAGLAASMQLPVLVDAPGSQQGKQEPQP